MKLEEVFPITIKDYGNERWRKRFYRNFPIERPSRSRRYYHDYDYYGKKIEQPKVKQPKPEPKPPKAVIENKFVLQELKSGYSNKIYGKFLLSTGETVQMQIKAPLVVDYINSGGKEQTVFVLGPDDQLYLEGSKEYNRRKALAEPISSKYLVPGYVYWCASVEYSNNYQNQAVKESQQLYLGKVKMTEVSRRPYEMVGVWYDIVSHTFARYATPKQQLHKFGEPEQNVIRDLKAEAERVLLAGKKTVIK